MQERFATESDRAVIEAENHRWLGWFCCLESYALSSVGDSARFLLGPGVDVLFPDNFEVCESGFCDDLFELCFQQGTGNSASPQIDIVFRCEWHCFRNSDVGYLETSTRFKYSEPLSCRCRFSGYEIENTV
jgi:hypothetical protein